jgi:hypothetical protein
MLEKPFQVGSLTIYRVTIHNTRYYYFRRRRVPLAEGYSLISENLHIAYANETEQLSVEVTPVPSGVEVDGIVVLPDPGIWKIGRALSETALALRLQMRGLETISAAQYNGRGPDSSLKGAWIFI